MSFTPPRKINVSFWTEKCNNRNNNYPFPLYYPPLYSSWHWWPDPQLLVYGGAEINWEETRAHTQASTIELSMAIWNIILFIFYNNLLYWYFYILNPLIISEDKKVDQYLFFRCPNISWKSYAFLYLFLYPLFAPLDHKMAWNLKPQCILMSFTIVWKIEDFVWWLKICVKAT